jgi:trehalose 6-phosphate synthase
MTEALIVNPYSIEETSEAIRAALEMSLEERCQRHSALLAGIKKHDAAAWSQSFLEYLKRVRSIHDPSSWRSPESVRTPLEQF